MEAAEQEVDAAASRVQEVQRGLMRQKEQEVGWAACACCDKSLERCSDLVPLALHRHTRAHTQAHRHPQLRAHKHTYKHMSHKYTAAMHAHGTIPDRRAAARGGRKGPRDRGAARPGGGAAAQLRAAAGSGREQRVQQGVRGGRRAACGAAGFPAWLRARPPPCRACIVVLLVCSNVPFC